MTDDVHTGGCLCGAVRYEARGPLADVTACHCGQCRRQSGHFYATTSIAAKGFTLTEGRGLRWYSASETARRGFCGECGSTLFWESDDGPWIGDLDGDQKLDIVFTNMSGTLHIDEFGGLRIHRLSTNIPIYRSIRWGAYMGTNGDGVY